LLPCNVVIREEDDGEVTVAFIDPEAMLSITGRATMESFAREVKSRLERVRDSLS